jgi:hypothetical protein
MIEKYLTLMQAAELIPTGTGKPPSLPTMHRWIFRGCDGVFLKHLRFGKRLYTTEQYLREFSEALANVDRDSGRVTQ